MKFFNQIISVFFMLLGFALALYNFISLLIFVWAMIHQDLNLDKSNSYWFGYVIGTLLMLAFGTWLGWRGWWGLKPKKKDEDSPYLDL